MDLTIIIPTKNRPQFIKKQLIYYRNQDFKGNILFLDSSSKEIFNKTKKFIFKNNYTKTEIFNIEGTSFDTFKSKASKVSTKYILFSGDDDFYIVKSLIKMIGNLEKSPKIIGITGKAFQIETGGINNDKVLSYNFYNIRPSMHQNPLERLKKITKNYSVVLFSILETQKFLEVVNRIPTSKKMHFTFQTELLPCFLIVLSGRIKKINQLFLFRLVGHSRVQHKTWDQLKKNRFFNNSYLMSINIIINFIRIKKKNTKKIKSDVKDYIDSYFSHSNDIQQKNQYKKIFTKITSRILRLCFGEYFYFKLKNYLYGNDAYQTLKNNSSYKKHFNYLKNNIIKNG
ncbi:MAG: hypothetical protein CMI73_00090 [Candidatus Pelagibacter sp.]|nr:hypothetical protein [Candidatus Pelagibacter sp.]OUV88653.1 MAG: hypothetical protein CBC96_00090 [Pelagibacteraceae bacterium TMED136]|tara:strand:+ start:3176 stop:4201 length:1026 start_codon:yes stop_codon:yes gene_type:complete